MDALLCSFCKGTGRETHKFIRNDGVEVEEIIECGVCKGMGKIQKDWASALGYKDTESYFHSVIGISGFEENEFNY